MDIVLYDARHDDVDGLRQMFIETINSVCASDYNSEQREVWCSAANNKARWLQKIDTQFFQVATIGGSPVGFGSLDHGSHVDFLYVHKDYQGKGVGHTLLNALEEKARSINQIALTSEVSLTARKFFERRGFYVETPQTKHVNGVEIPNFVMIKKLI